MQADNNYLARLVYTILSSFFPDLANLLCSCKTFFVLANKWMVVVIVSVTVSCKTLVI